MEPKADTQSEQWANDLHEIQIRILKLQGQFVSRKGIAADFVLRILSNACFNLAGINLTDLRQIAEDNPQ